MIFFMMIPIFNGHFLNEKLFFLRILKTFHNVLIEKKPNPRPFGLKFIFTKIRIFRCFDTKLRPDLGVDQFNNLIIYKIMGKYILRV